MKTKELEQISKDYFGWWQNYRHQQSAQTLPDIFLEINGQKYTIEELMFFLNHYGYQGTYSEKSYWASDYKSAIEKYIQKRLICLWKT